MGPPSSINRIGFRTIIVNFSIDPDKTPSTWAYNTFGGTNRSKGGKIGNQGRPSFTDKAAINSFTPGPGNYRLPT